MGEKHNNSLRQWGTRGKQGFLGGGGGGGDIIEWGLSLVSLA